MKGFYFDFKAINYKRSPHPYQKIPLQKISLLYQMCPRGTVWGEEGVLPVSEFCRSAHAELRCVFQSSFSAASQARAGDNSIFCRRWLLDSLVSFCLPHVVRKRWWSVLLLRCLRKKNDVRQVQRAAHRRICKLRDNRSALSAGGLQWRDSCVNGGRGCDNTVSWRNGGSRRKLHLRRIGRARVSAFLSGLL